jgi:hemolysin activation/secretion protein
MGARDIRARRIRRAVGALLVGLVTTDPIALPAAAQLSDVRPGDERPELPPYLEPSERDVVEPPRVPDFEPPGRPPGEVLPPLELPDEANTRGLEGGVQTTLREIQVHGNSVLSQEELEEIAAPHLSRPFGFAEVQQLRDALTAAYVDRGYVTSGVVIPPQSLADGLLEIWAVQGVVTSIRVETDGRLRESWVRSRLERAIGPPVNVKELERALQVLQQDEKIRSVDARLVPSERRGEALLRVNVQETPPTSLRIAGNNYNSPAIGSGRGEMRASYNNVTGFGDALRGEYNGGIGLQDLRGQWEWPVSPWDTLVQAHFRRTWSEVVEDPFDHLDIRSETETYGVRVSQPLYRSLNTSIGAFLIGEYRRSDSYLFDHHFSFVPGPDDGVAKIAVLRVGGDWIWRTNDQVVAARAIFNQGLPWFGATSNRGRGVPDDEFSVFLGQLQFARRFPELLGVELVLRGDAQLSDDPLFALEQFAVGGHDSVRGYRESRLVRDSALVGSVELRIPVPMPGLREWRPSFAIAPFFDVGRSWNVERGELARKDLMSVGIGGRLSLRESLDIEVYWGVDLKDIDSLGDDDTLQDDGIHLGLVWRQ